MTKQSMLKAMLIAIIVGFGMTTTLAQEIQNKQHLKQIKKQAKIEVGEFIEAKKTRTKDLCTVQAAACATACAAACIIPCVNGGGPNSSACSNCVDPCADNCYASCLK